MNYLIDFYTFINEHYDILEELADELLRPTDEDKNIKGSIIYELLLMHDNLDIENDLKPYQKMQGFI